MLNRLLHALSPIQRWALVGLAFRIIYFLFLAKPYQGYEDYYLDRDTWSFAAYFHHLWETGTFTLGFNNGYEFFGRMPGYSFFLGFFYVLSGENWDLAYQLAVWAQVMIDGASVLAFGALAKRLFPMHPSAGLWAAALYACYPFVVVWSAMAYSEVLAISFMLWGSLFFLNHRPFWGGALLGLAILTRPQTALILPALGIAFAWHYRKQWRAIFAQAAWCLLGLTVTYGTWPIRNKVLHDKWVFTQDLRGFTNWDHDALSFLQFMVSVQAGWEPQMTQIVTNQPVQWPDGLMLPREDSLLLRKTFRQAQTCSKGFSHWQGYWRGHPLNERGCTDSVGMAFVHLRELSIRLHPWRFWVEMPLKNLKKALFKRELTSQTTWFRRMASHLFLLRSALIMAGFFALIWLFWHHRASRMGVGLIGLFFALNYVVLCAGTGPQYRNIEMRYFLPADIMLLLPLASGLGLWWQGRRAKSTS
jgi:hypothetical protein